MAKKTSVSPVNTPHSILLLDDHPLFLQAAGNLLKNRLPYYSVLTAQTPAAAEKLLSQEPHIKLVLLDIRLAEDNSLKLLRTIKKKYPDIIVTVLTGHFREETVTQYLQAGADECLNKNEDPETILAKIINCLSHAGLPADEHKLSQEKPDTDDTFERLKRLSKRQKGILIKILQGKINKIIASEENISEVTVKIHVSAILKIMNADNRSHLIYLLNRSNINLISRHLQ